MNRKLSFCVSQHCFDSDSCLGQARGFGIFHLLHFLMPDEKEINLISSCNCLLCVLVTDGMEEKKEKSYGVELLCSPCYVVYKTSYPTVLGYVFYISNYNKEFSLKKLMN